MNVEQKSITGKESKDELSAPLRALSDFYTAFNAADLALMAENWAQSEDAVMDNPVGGIKRGWEAIRPVYEKLFHGSVKIRVEFYDYTLHESGDLFYVVGRERGELRSGSVRIELAIRTTRIFRRIEGQWKQVHHHGSIDDPQLLKDYQSAIQAGK